MHKGKNLRKSKEKLKYRESKKLSKKHIFLRVFSKITISVCVFCAFFISPVFAILPAGFTELEYIESTGTQYIDTGIVSYKNTYRYEFNIRKNINSTTFISFQNPTSGAENIGVFTNYSGYVIQNGSGGRVFLSVDNTNFHNIILEKDGVTLDGQKNAITSLTDFTVSRILYVFTCDAFESRRFVGSIALFKTYDENNNLILNLIPAKRNSDGEIGMYDTVSGTFFTNRGTGNFIAGPVA